MNDAPKLFIFFKMMTLAFRLRYLTKGTLEVRV